MSKKTIFAVAVLLILFVPVLMQSVEADTYGCKKVHVSSSYRKVGRTPQSITIYTKMKVNSDLMVSYWQFRNIKVEIESYYNHYRYGTGWYDEDTKSFYNTYGLGGKATNEEFTVSLGSYRKCWYCSTRYWKFTVHLPKDRDLYFHHTFPHRVKVTLNGVMAYATWSNIYNIQQHDFTIRGTSGKFSVSSTSYSDYNRYWGAMMTTTDYTTLEAEQESMEQIGKYDETFLEAHGGSDLLIIALSVVALVVFVLSWASYKKRQ